MAYFRVCPNCGDNLDPGERCDCEREKQKREEKAQRMLFVDRNGQMTFNFTKEEKFLEKAVV